MGDKGKVEEHIVEIKDAPTRERVVRSEGDQILAINRSQVFEPILRPKKESSSPNGELYASLDEIVNQRRSYEAYRDNLCRIPTPVHSSHTERDVESIKQDVDDEIRQQLALSKPRYEASIKQPLAAVRSDVDRKQYQAHSRAVALQIISYLISLFTIAAGVSITVLGALNPSPVSVPVTILGAIIGGFGTITMLFKPEQRAIGSFQAYTAYSHLKNIIYEFYLDPPDNTEQVKNFMKQIHSMHEDAARLFFGTMNLNATVNYGGSAGNTLNVEAIKST